MAIIPLNSEQAEAIRVGDEYLSHGDPNIWLGVFGKAGTGKTTIVEAMIEPYVRKKTILVIALAHKAKLIIYDKLSKAYGEDAITAKSVAGALGMNMNLETGRFGIDREYIGRPAIKTADIIICDECSMINEEGKDLIMTHKKKKAKVIFLGDPRQLPPIREKGDPNEGKPSPTFYTEKRVVLNQRVRQAENSPILPYSDFFGDNSRVANPLLNPAPIHARNTVVEKSGALVFIDDIFEALDSTIELYRYAVAKNLPEIIKTITYRNDARKKINTTVRSEIFGKAAAQQFLKDDLIIFTDNYTHQDADEQLSNSMEVQVQSAALTEAHGYSAWELGFIHEARPMHMMALHESEIKRHTYNVQELFTYAKSLPPGGKRNDAFGKAWELKKLFAPVEHSYAITSHKSQGSSYNTVIVDEGDIMSVGPLTNRAKSQSMYVGITRPTTNCIIIDGQSCDPEALYLSVELSKSKL